LLPRPEAYPPRFFNELTLLNKPFARLQPVGSLEETDDITLAKMHAPLREARSALERVSLVPRGQIRRRHVDEPRDLTTVNLVTRQPRIIRTYGARRVS
jgi:hypothetical protein